MIMASKWDRFGLFIGHKCRKIVFLDIFGPENGLVSNFLNGMGYINDNLG